MTLRIRPRPALVLMILLVLAAACGGGGGPGAGEGGWSPRTVAGLTLAAPGRLRAITAPVPAASDPAVRAAVERIDSFGRNVGGGEIRVSRVLYKPDVELSLRGSAQGAVDAVRGNPAISGFSHTHAAAEVSGAPALRTSMRFAVKSRPARGEMMTILRGRTLWQVQVLGPADETTADAARRVMESIQLRPEASSPAP